MARFSFETLIRATSEENSAVQNEQWTFLASVLNKSPARIQRASDWKVCEWVHRTGTIVTTTYRGVSDGVSWVSCDATGEGGEFLVGDGAEPVWKYRMFDSLPGVTTIRELIEYLSSSYADDGEEAE